MWSEAMRRPVVIALAASAVALGGAPGALAADHLWLDARASLSSGWDLRVSGNTDDNSFAGGVPSSGVLNVALQLRRGGAQEYHGYGSAQDELSFRRNCGPPSHRGERRAVAGGGSDPRSDGPPRPGPEARLSRDAHV